MITFNKKSLPLVLIFCATVLSTTTYKIPVKRIFPDRRSYARSSFTTPFYYEQYDPSRYGHNHPYFGYNSYYQERRFAPNDKFDDIHEGPDSLQLVPESPQSHIYKMGETSGRELKVPDEWNDLNWVVLIGRKPNKKKGQFRRKDMVKIKEFKQQNEFTKPYLPPTFNYFMTKNFDNPNELHKVAGPPYDDKIPFNNTYDHPYADSSSSVAAASSVEQKKEVFKSEKKEIFIPSKQFIPSPSKSDPNSMNPIVPSLGRSFQRDADAAPSEQSTSKSLKSGRSTHGRSLDLETAKLTKFSERPSYSFNTEDARPKRTRTPRVSRMDTREIKISKRTGLSSGENTVKIYATLGYPTRSFSRISRHLLV